MKYKVVEPFTDLFCNVRLRYYLIVKNTDLFCNVRIRHYLLVKETIKKRRHLFIKSRAVHPCQMFICLKEVNKKLTIKKKRATHPWQSKKMPRFNLVWSSTPIQSEGFMF